MSYPGLGKANYHDTRFGPLCLWQLADNMVDSVSGINMTLDTGTENYTDMWPGVRGFFFDGLTDLIHSTVDPRVILLGDMALEFIFLVLSDAGTAATYVSCDASGETSDTNYSWSFAMQSDRSPSYFAETGNGTNISYNPTGKTMAFGYPQHCAMVRQNAQVSFYQNGRLTGTSAGLVAPSDGSNGKLRFGTDAANSTKASGVMSSVKLLSKALTAAQVAEDFNVTLGGVYGYI